MPNKSKEPVVMRDLVDEIDPPDGPAGHPRPRRGRRRRCSCDLAKMPRTCWSPASTGIGKSVCMNAMICSMLLFRRPEEVRFIMVDPKMVELAGYEDIPHLLTPPITDMTKAHAALEWACQTMDERYFALRLVGVPRDRRLQRAGRGRDPLPPGSARSRPSRTSAASRCTCPSSSSWSTSTPT
ncbi:MAG: FtsK/SpoIIIE domain-containing protein [Paludibaculum sp.]